MKQEKWGIIYNYKAGIRRYTRKRWNAIREYLVERRVPFEYAVASEYGSAEELAVRFVKRGFRTIVIVGGDGAVNDVVNGIMKSDIKDKTQIHLGIIPNGIGNDFAAYWGINSNYKSAVETIINGSRKLFQVATNRNRKIVTMAGARMRSTMVKKILASPAPSMRAASSSSFGTEVCAYTRPRKKPNGETEHGMMIEATVLVRCRVWKIEYCGIVSRAAGMSMQAMTMPMATPLPRKLNLAVAYPAITDTMVPISAEVQEYSSELPTQRQNWPRVHPSSVA